MALIPDLPAATTVASTDVFVKDTGSATQKIAAYNLFKDTICGEGTELTSGDINTLTTPAHYRIPSYSQVSNLPSNLGGAAAELFVIYRGSTIRAFQILFVYNSSNTIVCTRAMVSASEWGAWTITGEGAVTNGNIDFTRHSAYIVTITDQAIDTQRREFVLTSATTRGFYLASNPTAIYAITFTVSVSNGTLSISDAKRATIGVANSMTSATLPTIYRITAIR